MHVAIFQGPQYGASLQANLLTLAQQAVAASKQGADLLICPEMFLTGYKIGPAAISELAQEADSEIIKQAQDIAKQQDIAILFGFPEAHQGKVYNAAVLIDENGNLLHIYRKTHLFGDIDRDAYSAGDTHSAIVNLHGFNIGILICYDVEFAENVRTLALAGADLIAVPTALMSPYEFVADNLVATRAYENQVYLAYANRCGEEQDLIYCGGSTIIAPDGECLARAGTDEALISAEFSLDDLQQKREFNTYFNDRRPRMYTAVSQKKH